MELDLVLTIGHFFLTRDRRRDLTPHVRPKYVNQIGVIREFRGVELGDARRRKRLMKIVTKLDQKPDDSFPQALATEGDLEAFYRFVRNRAVGFDVLFAGHRSATVDRATTYAEVLAVHDTTEFSFGGTRAGMGRLKKGGHGFLAHFTQIVSAEEAHAPLGTVAVESWARNDDPTPTALRQQKKITYKQMHAMPSEQDRWLRGVDAAEAAVGGRTSLIHVMDSEADDYCLMAALVESRRRWVIRLCYDRKLAEGEIEQPTKTRELVAQRDVACTREVKVSRRRKQPGSDTHRRRAVRPQRTATLAISATAATFRAPPYVNDQPRSLGVHIVAAREVDPPADHEPIEWLLITTEPIDTDEQILKVVDTYRGRWVIEEYFKALKTGCAFEARELESWHTIQNALGLLVPVAWRLLDLRTRSRDIRGDEPATHVLTELEIQVLRHAAEKPLPAAPTVRDVLLAIARLGGHLRSNGEPGWRVLGRGYQDLLMMVAGFKLARAANM